MAHAVDARFAEGASLPEISLLVTYQKIVMTPMATWDLFPGHNDPSYAQQQGQKSIYLNTVVLQGFADRVAGGRADLIRIERVLSRDPVLAVRRGHDEGYGGCWLDGISLSLLLGRHDSPDRNRPDQVRCQRNKYEIDRHHGSLLFVPNVLIEAQYTTFLITTTREVGRFAYMVGYLG